MNYTKLSSIEYRTLSERTVSPNFWATKDLNISSKTGRIQELHMAIGLVTEVQELMLAVLKPTSDDTRLVNIGEEIADAGWYVAGLERLWGLEIDQAQGSIAVHTPMNIVVDLIKDSVDILDCYKKSLFYNAPLNAKAYSCLRHVVNNLETLAIDFNHDSDVLRAKNINKLWVRFPEKFTEEDANIRNLGAEYEKLK